MPILNVEAAQQKVPVTFSGGHETDPKDHGRPVVLVAGALGVKPEVFREAFRGVRPARGRGPTGDEARRNKEALLKVLAPFKVTNERLDEVSDYYRYRPEKDELWPTAPAKAHAIIEDGKIKRIVVTQSGSGYSSPPVAIVKGFENIHLVAEIKFEKDLKKNGGVESIVLARSDHAKKEDVEISKAVSPNKQTVHKYMEAFSRSDHPQVLSCLTDDVEWVVPGAFHITGKDAFDKEIENEAFVGSPKITVTRMIEENDVIVAEGGVRTERKDGGILNLVFCDVFVMRDGKIKQLTSYLMEVKE